MAKKEEIIRPDNVVSYKDTPARVLEVLPSGFSRIRIMCDSKELVVENSQLIVIAGFVSDKWDEALKVEFTRRRDSAHLEEVNLSKTKYYIAMLYRSKEIDISTACGVLGCKKSTFYKIIKKTYSAFGAAVLIRDVRGRKTGTTMLAPELEKIINIAVSKKLNGKAASFAKVHEEVKNLCAESGLKPPSRATVVARIKKIPEKVLYKLKNGTEAAKDKYGAKPGKLITKRALQVFQMDHTLADVIICDPCERKPLGRPWLTLVIDVHTRVIVGYYISLRNPSTVSVACAIAFSIMPKDDFIKSIGCKDLVYPFYGKPEAIHLDNAAEFKTISLQKACSDHDIKINWRPIGKKHYGGHIERLIRTLMIGHVHLLPGTTYSNVQQRKGYDSEKESALTFKEFGVWFARQVVIYNGTLHSSIKKSPGDAWIENVGEKNQKTYTPSEVFLFRLDFMPEVIRKVTTKGIRFKNTYYYSPALQHHVGLEGVLIKYDPYSLERIWAKIDGAYIETHYADVTKDDITYEDYYAENVLMASVGQDSWLDPSKTAEIRRKNEELISQALRDKKGKRKSNAALAEYNDYIASTFPDPEKIGVEGSSQIDYSEKPVPYRSDD